MPSPQAVRCLLRCWTHRRDSRPTSPQTDTIMACAQFTLLVSTARKECTDTAPGHQLAQGAVCLRPQLRRSRRPSTAMTRLNELGSAKSCHCQRFRWCVYLQSPRRWFSTTEKRTTFSRLLKRRSWRLRHSVYLQRSRKPRGKTKKRRTCIYLLRHRPWRLQRVVYVPPPLRPTWAMTTSSIPSQLPSRPFITGSRQSSPSSSLPSS